MPQTYMSAGGVTPAERKVQEHAAGIPNEGVPVWTMQDFYAGEKGDTLSRFNDESYLNEDPIFFRDQDHLEIDNNARDLYGLAEKESDPEKKQEYMRRLRSYEMWRQGRAEQPYEYIKRDKRKEHVRGFDKGAGINYLKMLEAGPDHAHEHMPEEKAQKWNDNFIGLTDVTPRKQKALITGLMGAWYNKPTSHVSQNYAHYRQSFFEEMGLQGQSDDNKVFGEAKRWLNKRVKQAEVRGLVEDATLPLVDSAILKGMSAQQTIKVTTDALVDQFGEDAVNRPMIAQASQSIWKERVQQFAPVISQARRMYENAIASMDDESVPLFDSDRELLSLVEMDREDRRRMMGLVMMMTKEGSVEYGEGFSDRMAERLIRSSNDQVFNVDFFGERLSQYLVNKLIPEDAMTDQGGRMRAAEEKLMEVKRETVQDLRDIKDISRRIESDNKLVQMMYDSAASVPFTLTAAIPGGGGVFFNALAMGAEDDQALRHKAPDLDSNSRFEVAMAKGATKSLIERAAFRAMIKPFPKIEAGFKKLGVRGTTGTAAGRITGAYVTEYTEEVLQQVSDLAIEDVAGIFHEEIPDVSAEEWQQSLGELNPLSENFDSRTALAVLPMAVLFGGGSTAIDRIGAGKARELLGSVDSAWLLGASKEDAQSIAAEKDVLKAHKMLVEAIKSKTAEERKANSKQAEEDGAHMRLQAEKIRKNGTETEKARLEEYESDVEFYKQHEARIEPTEDGQFKLIYPETMNKPNDFFDSEQEAVAQLNAHKEDVAKLFDDHLATANQQLEAMQEAGSHLDKTHEGRKQVDEHKHEQPIEFAQRSAENMQKMLERVQRDLNLNGVNRKATVEDIKQYRILGDNMIRKKARGYVARLAKNANVSTVIEEGAEGFIKDLTMRGDESVLEKDWVKQQILLYNQAAKTKVTTAESVEEMSDQDMVEAFSDMAMANFWNSRQHEQLPSGLRGIINGLRRFFLTVMEIAADLKQLRAEGKLGKDFETLLDQAIGINMDEQVSRMTQETQQEIAEEIEEDQQSDFSIAPNGAYEKGGWWHHATDNQLKGGKLKRFAGGSDSDMGGIFLVDDSDEGKRYSAGYGNKMYRVQVDLEPDQVFNLGNEEHRQRVEPIELDDAVGTDFLRNADDSAREGTLDWTAIEPELLEEAGFKAAILYERPSGMYGENPVRSLSVFDEDVLTGLEEVSADEVSKIREFKPVNTDQSFSITSDNVKLNLINNGQVIELAKIESSKRGEGYARKAMEKLTAYADENGKVVTLTPTTEFGANKNRLVDFYKQFGFVENKGRNKDYEITNTMYRLPVGSTFSITPAQDAAYMKAVESGDVETQQQMVYDLARSKGYKVAAFHQTTPEAKEAIFKEGFRLDKGRARLSDEQVPDAFFFKLHPDDIGVGSSDAVQIPAFLKYENPIVLRDRDEVEKWARQNDEYSKLADEIKAFDEKNSKEFDEIWATLRKADTREDRRAMRLSLEMDERLERWQAGMRERAAEMREIITNMLNEKGYDAFVLMNDEGSLGRKTDNIAVFNKNQIKSADPITYDSSGNVIPLSERFDEQDDRITHSIKRAGDPVVDRIHNLMRNDSTRLVVYRRMVERLGRVREQAYARQMAMTPHGYHRDDAKEAMKDMSTREIISANIAQLEAIRSVLPPEVRAKIGGARKMTEFKSIRGLENYLVDRIEMIDKHLENYLKKDFKEKIDKVVERSTKTVTKNKNVRGTIGVEHHRVAAEAKAAMEMDGEQAQERIDALRDELDEVDVFSKKGVNKFYELDARIRALEFFYDYENADSSRLEKAYDFVLQNHGEGRRLVLEELMNRRELRDSRVKARVDAMNTGKSAVTTPDVTRAAAKERGLWKRFENFLLQQAGGQFKSLTRITENMKDKDEGRRLFLEMFDERITNETDAGLEEMQVHDEFFDTLNEMLGGFKYSNHKARKFIYEAKKLTEDHGVTKIEGREEELTKVDKLEVEDILENGKEGYTEEDIESLRDAYEEFKTKSPRSQASTTYIRFIKVIDTGERVTLGSMSELQLLNLWLTMNQSTEADKLELQGYDSQTFDEIGKFLRPTTKKIAAYMLEDLKSEGQEINKIHEEEYFVSVPLNDNYFPVNNIVVGKEAENTPGGQQTKRKGGVGALKVRTPNKTEPDLTKDALGVYFAHRKEMAWWKKNAKWLREWEPVIKDREFAKTFKVRVGAKAYSDLLKYFEQIRTQGTANATTMLELEDIVARLQSKMALGILGGRLSTVMVNATGLLNAGQSVDVSTKDLVLASIKNIVAPKGAVKAAWDNPLSQLRLGTGASILAATAKESVNNSKRPGLQLADDLAQKSLEPMQYIDVGMNSLGMGAIYRAVYDKQISQGVGEQDARKEADKAVSRSIAELAQPTLLSSKSALEMKQKANPILGSSAMFLSEARKRLMVNLFAARTLTTGKGEMSRTRAARVLIINAMFARVMEMAIRELVRVFIKGDDEDKFWERVTSWEYWTYGLVSQAYDSIPVLKEAIDYGVKTSLSEKIYSNESMLVSQIKKTAKIDEIFDGEQTPTERVDSLIGVMQGVGSVSIPLIAVAANMGEPVMDIAKESENETIRDNLSSIQESYSRSMAYLEAVEARKQAGYGLRLPEDEDARYEERERRTEEYSTSLETIKSKYPEHWTNISKKLKNEGKLPEAVEELLD